MVFALDYAAFGVVMILFLLLEPAGLIGLWRRLKNAFAARRGEDRVMTAASHRRRFSPSTASQVAYHRVAVALHGVSLRVMPQTIVALLGNNGAGKTTTLRAISGFIGIDDARVTAGHIRFAGQRIENQPPHANTARGIVLVPERDKVFPNLTVAENLTVAASHRANAAERRQLEALVFQFFPALARAAVAARRAAVRRRTPDAGVRQRHRLQARTAAGR